MSLQYRCDKCGKTWLISRGGIQNVPLGTRLAEALVECDTGHVCAPLAAKISA